MGFVDDRLAGAGPEATVRAVAARLRAEAVSATGREVGADVVAELARRAGLEVVDREPASMGGRDARLRRGSRILVSTALGSAARVRAVAHELGHQHLHDDPDLEDGRQAERSDVAAGSAAVQGYSPDELREVHADVFADELLCSADGLRARLAGGATIGAVAGALGIAPDVVRRQAVHALLLPLAPPRAWRRGTPDPRQTACVERTDGPLLVVGGPGSGKTATLLDRARRILAEPDVKPSSLVVLAPTAAAADALRAALASDDPRVATHSHVLSFQDFAFEIVARWADRVGRRGPLKVLDRVALSRIVGEAVGRLASPARDALKDVLRAIERGDGAEGGPTEATGRTRDAVRRRLESSSLADAPGLPSLAVEVLRAAPDVREHLRGRFRHVLVDDLHLAPAVVVDLLRRLSPDTADVFAAGDPSQALDGRRFGASCPVLRFERLFATRRTELVRDHRRSPASSGAPGAVRKTGSGRRTGPAPARRPTTATALSDEAAEAEAVAARVASLARVGTPWRDQVVLAWSRSTLGHVEAALGRSGTPVAYVGNLASRPDVRAVVDFLALSVDRDATRLPAVARLRRYDVDAADAAAVVAEVGPRPASMAGALLAASARRRPDASTARGLALLAMDVALMRSDTMWRGLVDWLHPASGLPPLDFGVGDAVEARTRLFAVHQTLKACAEHVALGGRDAQGFGERLAIVNSLDQRTHYRRVTLDVLGLDAVRLMTVHEAAGREWPVVHVAGLWRARPRRGRRSARGDEEAVLRVALSRATRETHLTRPASRLGRAVEVLPSLAGLI